MGMETSLIRSIILLALILSTPEEEIDKCISNSSRFKFEVKNVGNFHPYDIVRLVQVPHP